MAGIDKALFIKEFLVKEKYFTLRYYKLKNRTNNQIVITFDPLNSKYFGVNFLLKYGYEVINVSHEQMSFYQQLSIEKFVQYVAPYIQNRDVFVYGSSLGAYAALYYGGAINGKIIAFSPLLPIDHDVKRLIKEYSGFTNIKEHIDLTIDAKKVPISSQQPVIVYDPFEEADEMFYQHHIKNLYPEANIVTIEYGSHFIAECMKIQKVLKPFILSLLTKKVVIPFKIDAMKNIHYLKMKATEAMDNKNYQDANIYVKSALRLEYDITIIKCISSLVLLGKTDIKPESVHISDDNKRSIFRAVLKKSEKSNEHFDTLWQQIFLHELMLDFQAALHVARVTQLMYQDNKLLEKKISRLVSVIEKSSL